MSTAAAIRVAACVAFSLTQSSGVEDNPPITSLRNEIDSLGADDPSLWWYRVAVDVLLVVVKALWSFFRHEQLLKASQAVDPACLGIPST